MAKYSPMMQQYFEIKREYQYCLLFFRLGDFYELFFDDAKIASRELDLTLTGRECGQEERAPMCGVPHHAADTYVARLIEKGYKVAICEQVEDPKKTKSIVRREVIRVVTPGTMIDTGVLDETVNNYIMCIYSEGKEAALAVADVSTGEFLTTLILDVNSTKLLDEVAKYNPAEILINQEFFGEGLFRVKPSMLPAWQFHLDGAEKTLCSHFGVHNLDGYGLHGKVSCISACGALMQYLMDTQKNALTHIRRIRHYEIGEYMVLDVSSRRNLELTETLFDRKKEGSLLSVLDYTKTPMGARLLRRWLEQPLVQAAEIQPRLDSVEELKEEGMVRSELREYLNTVRDLERIISKLTYKTAGGRDLISLARSIEHLPFIKDLVCQCRSSLMLDLGSRLDPLEDVYLLIHEAVAEDPPVSIREGGIMKTGYAPELDQLREAKDQGKTWILEMEAREKERTGIKNLKIKYNKVFGYCIEVTNSYRNQVPEQYIRRQTLSNCERYITEELKELEDMVLNAEDKIADLEETLFMEIVGKIQEQSDRILESAEITAHLDVIQSLAETAERNHYVKPLVDHSGTLDIREGRHPVVERSLGGGFIPNDVFMNTEDQRMFVITGPNMAGKSTYMRQTALIVLMAQIGSFIPAGSGNIGIVDRIFTRVGASDDLATGRSTFMVEMSEVANILHNATKNSLIILDEIGRGTSTNDGLSIAQAVLEYVVDKEKIGARTMFATHYHELTLLEGEMDGVVNYCISVKEDGDDIVFLHKIQKGGASRSYGIHVAQLAGIPQEIIHRSKELMEILQIVKPVRLPQEDGSAEGEKDEEYYYDPPKRNRNKNKFIISELQRMDLSEMTPMEAYRRLCILQRHSRELEGES